MELSKRLTLYLQKHGIELSSVHFENILKELSVWLCPSVEGSGVAKTQEGDYTIIHPHYREPYHSLSAGAVRECLEKFLKPSGLLERAEHLKRVRILDVGFGLGYNLAVAIRELRAINPRLEIEILSFEKELLRAVPPLPETYQPYLRLLWDGLPGFEREGISFRLLLGDARERIREVEEFKAHAVFHDGFSPYRNPELWSLHFLERVKGLMEEEGVWVSYTSSLAVRKALKELGFRLSGTGSVGRKRSGTRACLVGRDELSKQEMNKINHSPYAIPFLDPYLDREEIEILIDYRVRVELLKMAQGGFEPPTPRFSAGCSTS